MTFPIKNEVWYYVERLCLHVHKGSQNFIGLLGSFDIEYEKEYLTDIHSFMDAHDHSIENFMSNISHDTCLKILKKIVFDDDIKSTQTSNFNYYGERVNGWYPKVIELLNSSNIEIDYENKTLKEKINLKLNLFLSRVSRFIVSNLSYTDWSLVSEICEVTNVLNDQKNERLIRSQQFEDPDYELLVYKFLHDVFNYNKILGMLLINEVISQKQLNEEESREYNQILKILDDRNWIGSLIQNIQNPNVEDFLDCLGVPDSFYRDLIDEINFQYLNNHPISVSILIRKLIENLLIDILRQKYGTSRLNLYYDTSRGRFHDFSVLLVNLDSCKEDFHYISRNLDQNLIKKINNYREVGNSGAHSVDVNLTNDNFSSKRYEINYIVNILLRISKNLSQP